MGGLICDGKDGGVLVGLYGQDCVHTGEVGRNDFGEGGGRRCGFWIDALGADEVGDVVEIVLFGNNHFL